MKRGTRRSLANQENGRSNAELPEDIVMDILSKLPVKTIFSCRRVCKTWPKLLLDPYFAQFHFSRAPLQFLLEPSPSPNNLLLAELDEMSCISKCDGDFLVDRKSLIDLKIQTTINDQSREIVVRNSCHGLLCLSVGFADDRYHIYNPITREQVVVMSMVKDDFLSSSCKLGFSLKTNEFKVLQFLRRGTTGEIEAHIQTLGSNSWRSIGVTPCDLWQLPSGPFLNGSLHWFCNKNQLIISFDFGEEKFHSLPAPSEWCGKECMLYPFKMLLGSLGGCLCMSYCHNGAPLDIWVMKEYGIKESWTKQFVIDNVSCMTKASFYQPIKVLNNGEILVLCDERDLISYDPRRRSIRHIKFYWKSEQKFSITPHIPSFIKVLDKVKVEGAKCQH